MKNNTYLYRLSFFFILFFTFCITCKAQVTIGSNINPNQGALLDIKENDNIGANSSRGLLLPRIMLENTTSLSPIFDDQNQTNDIKQSHVGLMIFNLKDDFTVNLCRGIYVWTEKSVWERLSDPCCKPINSVNIENNFKKEDFNFKTGSEVIFSATYEPMDATQPISYSWKNGSTNSNSKDFVQTVSGNGTIEITISNGCSTKTSSVNYTVYTPTCPSEKDKYHISPNILDFNQWNKAAYTFSISDLMGYTKEYLDDLGIHVQWYWKLKRDNPYVNHDKFYPIDQANSPSYTFVVGDNFTGTQDICDLAVEVTGNLQNIDCPINNGASYFRVLAQGRTENGDIQVMGQYYDNPWVK